MRHTADYEANNSPTRVVDARSGAVVDVPWRDVRVGDLVVVKNREVAPDADANEADAARRALEEVARLDPAQISLSHAPTVCVSAHRVALAGPKELAREMGRYMVFDEEGLTWLHRAAREGDAEKVKLLIEAEAHVHTRAQESCEIDDLDLAGCTALHLACYSPEGAVCGDRVNCVTALINAGADVNSVCDDYVCECELTPLHLAALSHEDNGDLVAALVSSGAEIDSGIESSGQTPLHLAITTNKPACIAQLVNFGANINAQCNVPGDSGGPLHMAARNGTSALADLLIAAGADVNLRDVAGRTALHQSVQYGTSNYLAALVKVRGANIDQEDRDGNTPFHYAMVGAPHVGGALYSTRVRRRCLHDCRRCIGLLFEAGAFFSTPAPWTTTLQKRMFFEFYFERAHGPALEYMQAIAKAGSYEALVRDHRGVFSALIQRALESRFGWIAPQVVAEQILGFWMPPGGW